MIFSFFDVGGGVILFIIEEIVMYIIIKIEFVVIRDVIVYYNRILKSEISKSVI